MHSAIDARAGADLRQLCLRRRFRARQHLRRRGVVDAFRRSDARFARPQSPGQQSRHCRCGRSRGAGPGAACGRPSPVSAAVRGGDRCRGQLRCTDEDRAVLRRRTDARMGDIAFRCPSAGRPGRACGFGFVRMGVAGHEAVGCGRGRDDLFHVVGVPERFGDRAPKSYAAERIRRPDRLDVPLRHVGRRGTRTGPESALYGRGGYSALRTIARTDCLVVEYAHGRCAAA